MKAKDLKVNDTFISHEHKYHVVDNQGKYIWVWCFTTKEYDGFNREAEVKKIENANPPSLLGRSINSKATND